MGCYSWKVFKTSFHFSKKAMRATTFSGPIAHTPPLFLDLQIFKLEDIYCICISFLPMSVSTTLLQFILGIISLRSLNFINIIPEVPPVVTFFLLEKIQCNMAYGSICFNGVKSWNTIPSDIRNSPFVSIFKMKIKNFLLDSCSDWTWLILVCIFYYYMTNSYRPGLKKFDWFKAGL